MAAPYGGSRLRARAMRELSAGDEAAWMALEAAGKLELEKDGAYNRCRLPGEPDEIVDGDRSGAEQFADLAAFLAARLGRRGGGGGGRRGGCFLSPMLERLAKDRPQNGQHIL